jgi:hypothetical protein
LKNALVAFFNLAKLAAQPFAARETPAKAPVVSTSHPCDDAARRKINGL